MRHRDIGDVNTKMSMLARQYAGQVENSFDSCSRRDLNHAVRDEARCFSLVCFLACHSLVMSTSAASATQLNMSVVEASGYDGLAGTRVRYPR